MCFNFACWPHYSIDVIDPPTLITVVGIAYSNAQFGIGSGPIYLTDVSCSSSKTSLLQCNSDPILSSGCTHSEDAGVKCEGIARDSQYEDNTGVESLHFLLQLHVLMDSWGWPEAMLTMRVELRSVWAMSGGQSVMTTGVLMMPMWPAVSWVLLARVRYFQSIRVQVLLKLVTIHN